MAVLGARLFPVLVVAACLGGCSKRNHGPCHGITPSNDAKRLGIVLTGGRVCKETGPTTRGTGCAAASSADIEYPHTSASSLPGKYQSALNKAGWNSMGKSGNYAIFATRGSDAVLIEMGQKSPQRVVSFVDVSYCTNGDCSLELEGCFDRMAYRRE